MEDIFYDCPHCTDPKCPYPMGDCSEMEREADEHRIKHEVWHVDVASDVVRGPWREDDYEWHEVFRVTVRNEYGRRFAHKHVFLDDSDGAKKLAERVHAADRWWTPVENEHWRADFPVYGSEHYERSGGDAVHHLDIEPELDPALSEYGKHMAAFARDGR